MRHSPGLGWAYSRGFWYQRLSTVQVTDPGEEGPDAFTGVPRTSTSKEGDHRTWSEPSRRAPGRGRSGRRQDGDVRAIRTGASGLLPQDGMKHGNVIFTVQEEMVRSEVRCCPVQRTSRREVTRTLALDQETGLSPNGVWTGPGTQSVLCGCEGGFRSLNGSGYWTGGDRL